MYPRKNISAVSSPDVGALRYSEECSHQSKLHRAKEFPSSDIMIPGQAALLRYQGQRCSC